MKIILNKKRARVRERGAKRIDPSLILAILNQILGLTY